MAPETGAYASPDRLVEEILDQVYDGNSDSILERFDKLEESIEAASAPLDEGQKFLLTFIDEINAKYGTALTILDACQLVRTNLDSLQVPTEAKGVILATIDILEANPNAQRAEERQEIRSSEYLPANILYFALIGRDKKKSKKKGKKIEMVKLHTELMETELPGNCYMGGCEFGGRGVNFPITNPGCYVAWRACDRRRHSPCS